MFKQYWERTRCECCREWMEPGAADRVWVDKQSYHWNCYWRIIWPQKARMERLKKRMKVAAK